VHLTFGSPSESKSGTRRRKNLKNVIVLSWYIQRYTIEGTPYLKQFITQNYPPKIAQKILN